MDKAGLILENAHARLRQDLVVGARHGVDIPFVRNAGGNDAHIDAGLCRDAQRRDHLVVQNQIRRHDPDAAAGRLDEALENRRADVLMVQRAVCKGLQIPFTSGRFRVIRAERRNILLQTRDIVPDAQKHHDHRPDRLAADQNAAVLPMPEALDFVDVFVREIDPSRKADLSVDDHELAVVAVVESAGEHGDKGIEHVRLNAHLAQLFAVAHRKAGDAAEIVVHHAHVDALHRLAAQHVQDRVPHLAVIDDEKFEKNIVLRLFQLLKHARKAALAARKIDRLRVIINRVTRAGKQVARMVPRRNICFFQRLHHALVLPQMLGNHNLDARHAAVFPVGNAVAAEEQIDRNARNREGENQNDPRHLIRRIASAGHNGQHRNPRNHTHCDTHPVPVFA